jgi:hypothetical protein
MTSSQLQQFARFGAQARLQAIEAERKAIVEAFPDLRTLSGSTNGAAPRVTRGRKGMSPSQRKAVGERMRAYWAMRRSDKAATTTSGSRTAADGTTGPPKQRSTRKRMSPATRTAHGERMRAYWAARRAAKGEQVDGARAESGAGSSGKRTGVRKSGRKEARKK